MYLDDEAAIGIYNSWHMRAGKDGWQDKQIWANGPANDCQANDCQANTWQRNAGPSIDIES